MDNRDYESSQREDILKLLQHLGNPQRVDIPKMSGRSSSGFSMMVRQRFGYQEVPIEEITRSDNGDYSAGNREDGHVSISRLDTNNLFEVQQALHKAIQSPIMRQYADIKKQMPNLVPLFHVSGGYETYQGDAERVGKILKLPVQESQTHLGPDGKAAKVVTIPQTDIWKSQNKLMSYRIPFAILEDMNKGKEINESPRETSSSVENRNLSRDVEQTFSGGLRR